MLYDIFDDISTISNRILMVGKAKLVFGLLNEYDPNLPNPIYKTKSTKTNLYLVPNLLNQKYQTK